MSVTLKKRKIFKIVRLPQNFKNLNDFLKNLLSALTLYILDKNLQLQYYGFLEKCKVGSVIQNTVILIVLIA